MVISAWEGMIQINLQGHMGCEAGVHWVHMGEGVCCFLQERPAGEGYCAAAEGAQRRGLGGVGSPRYIIQSRSCYLSRALPPSPPAVLFAYSEVPNFLQRLTSFSAQWVLRRRVSRLSNSGVVHQIFTLLKIELFCVQARRMWSGSWMTWAAPRSQNPLYAAKCSAHCETF